VPIARYRSFDPRRVGTLERDAWVAYYEHRWGKLLLSSVALVRAGFRLGAVRTLQGAWHVLRANQLWAPFPDNDADGARRHMARFYALVGAGTAEALDPEVAARLEVDWWRTHRQLQREPSASGATVDDLVDALTALYAYVYGVDRGTVVLAAKERANAMVLSDRWVSDGCPAGSLDLAAEGAALVRSYAALLAAVHR
jgi:hypothetical protein